MLHRVKRISVFMAVCGLLGAVAATAAAPSAIAWNYTPGAGSAMCNCREVSMGTAMDLIKAQVTGLVAGAVAGLALGIWWLYREKKKHAAAMTTTTTTATTTPPPADAPKT